MLEQGRDGREEFGKVRQAAVTKRTGGESGLQGHWKQWSGPGKERAAVCGAAGKEGG